MPEQPNAPALRPDAVAVWGISQVDHQSLQELRDYAPAPEENLHDFLKKCKILARSLLSGPDLQDQYESGASALLQLQLARAQIAELESEAETMQSIVVEKERALSRTEKALELYQATAGPTAAADQSAKIPDPPTFSKGRPQYRTFRAKLKEKLRGDARKFRDDEHQLSYAMGFLEDEAYEVALPLRENRAVRTVDELLAFLDATYEDPDRKGTAERELRSLKQANSDFTSHYAKFQSIMAVLGWEGDAKRSSLYQSLSYELKEALARTLPPPNETFDQYVSKIKLLDDQLRRFAAETKGAAKPASNRPARPAATATAAGSRTYSSNPADSTGATSHTGSAPMDLSMKVRTEAQQARFNKWLAEGKCTRCGDASHWRRDCPRRPLAAASADTTPYATAPATPAQSVASSTESGKD